MNEAILHQNTKGIIISHRDDGVIDRITDDGMVYREQDVSDVLESCKEQRAINDKMKGFRTPRDMTKVAEIPVAIVDILMARGIDLLNDEEALLKFINDPAFAMFRTSEGRV